MNKDANPDPHESIALRRYTLITEIKNLVDQGLPLVCALKGVAQKTEQDPVRRVAARTLEDWWYAWQQGGFAALKPKARTDSGSSRKLTAEQQQRILDAIRERLLFTLQADLEAGLKLPGQAPTSLEELNQRLAEWLAEYHTRVHSTTGETPEKRFASQAHRVHALDPQLDLDRLFYAQQTRLVRKDAMIRLDNDWYEVPLCLRGLEVRLRYDPWKRDRVEIDYRGQSFGLARKLNRQFNGQPGWAGL
jgi:transposase